MHPMRESRVSERSIIEERLKKKQAEIDGLEDKLRAAKVYMAALRDVLRDVDKRQRLDEDDGADAKLRAGSATAQARDIILGRGAPVHIDDILEAMGKEVTRDAKASLAGSLAAYVRREEIFTRPAPNTYGLVELGHTEGPEEEEEPPVGFGDSEVSFAPEDPIDLDDDIPF